MIYDVAMLVVLLYNTIRGAARGMAWQLAAIAALVLCFLFATPLSLVVAPSIPLDAPLNRWVAMLTIYLLFSFGCFAIARMLRGWLEALKFEEFDKHLGAVFGLLKGAGICLVVTFFVVCLSDAARDYVLRTRSGHVAGRVFEHMTMVLPAEFDRLLLPYLQRVDHEYVAQTDEPRDGDPSEDRSPLEPDGNLWDEFRGSRRPQDDDRETDFRERDSSEERPSADADEETGKSDSPLRDLVDRAVDSLGERVREGVSNVVRDALGQGNQGADAPRSPGKSNTEESIPEELDELESKHQPERPKRPAGRSLEQLLIGVSRLLAPQAEQQSSRREAIEALLQGVPESVAAGALADWDADLRGASTDPDPETDLTTTLYVRIWRQLEAAGVSLEKLPRSVRERLEEAQAE